MKTEPGRRRSCPARACYVHPRAHRGLWGGARAPFGCGRSFRVPGVATRAGLAVDQRGRMIVDAGLRSVSHPDVVGIGDAAASRVRRRRTARPTSPEGDLVTRCEGVRGGQRVLRRCRRQRSAGPLVLPPAIPDPVPPAGRRLTRAAASRTMTSTSDRAWATRHTPRAGEPLRSYANTRCQAHSNAIRTLATHSRKSRSAPCR